MRMTMAVKKLVAGSDFVTLYNTWIKGYPVSVFKTTCLLIHGQKGEKKMASGILTLV